MRTATRFPLERIAAFVRAGEFPNASTIPRKFEVSRRTLQRDIEFLRDRLGAPSSSTRSGRSTPTATPPSACPPSR